MEKKPNRCLWRQTVLWRTEDGVLAVEPGAGAEGDEELTAVVGVAARHRRHPAGAPPGSTWIGRIWWSPGHTSSPLRG